MTGAKFDIEKFNGNGDFGLWSIKMRYLLIQNGCEATMEVLPADMEAEAKAKLNKKAHSVVILCLGNKVSREVTAKTTAVRVWSKLEALYMTKSLANKLYIKEKVKFEDEYLALLLITSLLASYEHFVDTLLYGHEALTLEDVMATLNSKEIKERSKAKGMMVKDYMDSSVLGDNREWKIRCSGKWQVLEKHELFGKKSLGKLDFCENYVQRKSDRVSFGVGSHTTQGVINYVHSDLCGPSQVESLRVKGLAECKASASNLRRIQVKDIVKEAEDYLKTYSSAAMDINYPIMSGTVPPIPLPLGEKTGNTSSPNRVDTTPTDNTNNTTTNNVAQNVVDENLPQLLDSRGEEGPFVPLLSLSTSTNPLPKPQKQWLHADRRLANQDKRLKSIIISCLPNDVMKSVIKCKTAKAMWNDFILAYEGPSDIRDTKIATLRLKFNAFKALEGEKDNDSDVEEDLRSSCEFMADLNAEYHERVVLASQKRFYKRYRRVRSAKKLMDKSNETCFAYGKVKYKGLKAEIDILTKKIDAITKGKSEKGLGAESFDWDEESVSSDDEGVTKVKTFMAIAKDELSVGKADVRVNLENESLKDEISDLKKVIEKWTFSRVTLDQLLSKQVPSNIIHALGGNSKRKEKNSSKEVVFTKADGSPYEIVPEITSDSESECDTQEPLPPLPKIKRFKPTGTSNSLISLADLTLTMTVPKKTKQTSDKVSPANFIKKNTETKSSSDSSTETKSCPDKKADSSTKQLLRTLMEEVKYLKEKKIKTPSENSPSVSQTGSSKASKRKQKT
ncbi:hypothetical protein Tco_1408527 [Tanacetum coccineum]